MITVFVELEFPLFGVQMLHILGLYNGGPKFRADPRVFNAQFYTKCAVLNGSLYSAFFIGYFDLAVHRPNSAFPY